MSTRSESFGHVAAFGRRVAGRVWVLMVPAGACLAAATWLWPEPSARIFAALSVALAGAAFWVRMALWLDGLRARRRWRAAAEYVRNARMPSYVTDPDGRIQAQSPHEKPAGSGDAPTVQAVLGAFVADPSAIVRRLHDKAAKTGFAEEIAGLTTPCRISAQILGAHGCLWQIEPASAKAEAGPAEIALPMLTVSQAQTVTAVNPAMRALLGGHPATLDRIVHDLPLRNGRTHRIATASGSRDLRVAVIQADNGSRHVYVWPSDLPETRWSQFDALPVPLVKIAPDGEILAANPRARSLLGLEDRDGLNFVEVVEGLGRPVDEWLRDTAEIRGGARPEVVRATLTDREMFLQVALGRVAEGGEVALLAVLTDATELKTLEAQFVQSQKMQAIGQLAGGVAHDFNNLLTAISGHCDLLLLRHDPSDPDYSDLMQINQNANRAASLVGQLLAFSRKQNMQPELIDLRDTLGDLTHLLNRLVGERIELSFQHDQNLPQIRVDKRQLEQVMMNLVVNARDAMTEGGQIRIDTRAVRLSEPLRRDRASVPRGDYVLVRVEDSGCGIAPDRLPKIFEPFYSTKRVGEGTGLGLSMAYGIVKQSGGFIFADSVVGQGTAFSLYFPAHRGRALEQSAETRPRKLPPAPSPRGGVVLLVEDEAPVRAFASRALRLRGYTVLEAENAEEALRTLEDRGLAIDVFVTDVVMPGMDGPSWVSKALETRPETRVVFVSGYAEDSFSHQRAKIPNSVFLPKPFSLSQLTETVQRQLH